MSYLSSAHGLTLTLAGVTGIIVSVGVTVDSYVVYFERLKDEVRTGKTVRSSLEPGFVRSWRTIVAADLVSLIGAGVLYVFATSSVRGFAFFLGLSTAMDLLLAYCFMHPMVSVLARRPTLVQLPGVGIAVRARRRGSDGMTDHHAAAPRRRPTTSRGHPPAPAVRLLPRAHQLPVHQAHPALGDPLGHAAPVELRRAVRPRPQLRHRLRGRHVVAGADGARPHARTSPTCATCCGPLGFADAKVSTLSGQNGQSVNVQEHLVADPIKTIEDALATYGGVTPADVQFQRGQGRRHVHVHRGVDGEADRGRRSTPSLAKTELRGQTVTVSGQDVTITAKTLPVSPTEKVADALGEVRGHQHERR